MIHDWNVRTSAARKIRPKARIHRSEYNYFTKVREKRTPFSYFFQYPHQSACMEPHVVDPQTGQLVRLNSDRGQQIYQSSLSQNSQASTPSRAASLQWGAGAAEWSSSCGDCCDDCGICCKGFWCPCCLHGDIKEHVDGVRPGSGSYTVLCCIQSWCCLPCFNCTTCCSGKPLRSKLRRIYGLSKSGGCCGSDCCTHYCCHSCGQCQEAREIWFRGEALKTTLASTTPAATTPPPVIMMEPSHKEEKKEEKVSVGYEVAFKNGTGEEKGQYSGLESQIFTNGSSGWQFERDINDWIKSKLANNTWDGVLAYNDQSDKTCKGHAKGIVVWNKQYVGWLIHSVPHWPSYFIRKAEDNSIYSSKGTSTKIEGTVNVLPSLPDSCKREGQSFMWTLLDRRKSYRKGSIKNGHGIVDEDTPVSDVLEEIYKVVNAIGACVVTEFFSENAEKELNLYHHDAQLNPSTDMTLLSLSPDTIPSESHLVHVFKTEHWAPEIDPSLIDKHVEKKSNNHAHITNAPDFYRHGLLEGFGPMVTRTHVGKTNDERRDDPKICNGKDHLYYCDALVQKADTSCFQVVHDQGKEHKLNGTDDHSKIAYSSKTNDGLKWVFVGDLNRNTAQGLRAGGGILVKDQMLWTLFQKRLENIQPKPGLEYDF